MNYEPMRLIEFAYVNIDEPEIPYVGFFDAKDISRITQYDKRHCLLLLKDGQQHYLCGQYRNLTNRWIYTLEKRNHFYEDHIIRPSMMIFHQPEALGPEAIYFDSYQLYQLIKALRAELLIPYQHLFTHLK